MRTKVDNNWSGSEDLINITINIVKNVHWIIQNTIQIVLVGACVSRIPIKDLSNAVYTCSTVVVGPE